MGTAFHYKGRPDFRVFVDTSFIIFKILQCLLHMSHDDVIKWKHFPRYWPFVREFTGPRHKGQCRGALMFSLICTRINSWVNNGSKAGVLRRYRAHYDVIVMTTTMLLCMRKISPWYISYDMNNNRLIIRASQFRTTSLIAGSLGWERSNITSITFTQCIREWSVWYQMVDKLRPRQNSIFKFIHFW